MRNETIMMWFCKRSTLLIALWQMYGLPPYDKSAVAIQSVLRTFCQDLMDYASEGHFRIYEQFLPAVEIKSKQIDYEKIIQQITDTTYTLLEFNDAFDNHENLAKHANFQTFLSVICETLARRFELEDELYHHWKMAMVQTKQTINKAL